MSEWTFFSNHGHVLACLAQDHEARLRDVAGRIGITERAVQKIVRDLQDAGVITVRKVGRRNRYRINGRKPLRHELEAHRSVSDLVELMQLPSEERPKEPAPAPRPKPEPEVRPAAEPEPAPDPEPASANAPADEPGAEPPRAKPAPDPQPKPRPRRKDPADSGQGNLF